MSPETDNAQRPGEANCAQSSDPGKGSPTTATVSFQDTLAEIDSMMPGAGHKLVVRDPGDIRPSREITQAEIAELQQMHYELTSIGRIEKSIRIGEKLVAWRRLFPPRSGWNEWCDRNLSIGKMTITKYIKLGENADILRSAISLRNRHIGSEEPQTIADALALIEDIKPQADPVESAKPAKRPKQKTARPDPKPAPVEVEAEVTTEPAENVVPFERDSTEPVTQYLTGDPYELVWIKFNELLAWIKSSFTTEHGIDEVRSPYSDAMECLFLSLRNNREMNAFLESSGLKFTKRYTKRWVTEKTVKDEPAEAAAKEVA